MQIKKEAKGMNPAVSETSSGRKMLLSKYAICNSKKPRIIKKQKAKRVLINIGLKTPPSRHEMSHRDLQKETPTRVFSCEY